MIFTTCLKARKTSTSFSMSLGDVFEKGYYIEPEYFVESGSFSKENIEFKYVSKHSCIYL